MAFNYFSFLGTCYILTPGLDSNLLPDHPLVPNISAQTLNCSNCLYFSYWEPTVHQLLGSVLWGVKKLRQLWPKVILALSNLSTNLSLKYTWKYRKRPKTIQKLTRTCQQLLALEGISIIFSNNETESEAQSITFWLLVAQLARSRQEAALVPPFKKV